MAWYGDNDIDEDRVVEKLLCVVPKKYSHVAIAIEMLLGFSELSIKEVTGHLKAVDNREQLPPSEPVAIGGKLLFTEEQWLAHQRERKKGRPRVLQLRVRRTAASVGRASGTRRRRRAQGYP